MCYVFTMTIGMNFKQIRPNQTLFKPMGYFIVGYHFSFIILGSACKNNLTFNQFEY